MKTIFKQSILELMSQEISNAEMNCKIIDRFELSQDELKQLEHECKLCGMKSEDGTVYGIPVFNDPKMFTTIDKAVKTLCRVLETDEGMYIAYKANIAMAFYDNYRWYFEGKGVKMTSGSMEVIHQIANDSATYFLKTLIGDGDES